MNDALDAIMDVMAEAFDPAFGEAWTRRQVADSLILSNTHFLLAGVDEAGPIDLAAVQGFTLSRQVADEEELLLIAVRPATRGKGIGKALMDRFIAVGQQRGSRRFFLEMRDGNQAEHLYRKAGFTEIGRRRGYYRGAAGGPIDAITFGRTCSE